MKPRSSKIVLLAGVGGDAHSVGLNILRRALSRAGFQIAYLGTQNGIADVQRASETVDAVLISNMDGHAMHYLRDVESLSPAGSHAIWYIGGNPSTQLQADLEPLKVIGFKRVFSGYVSPEAVLSFLDSDLGTCESQEDRHYVEQGLNRWSVQHRECHLTRTVASTFLDERDSVLDTWPTGAGARDMAGNARRLRSVTLLAAAQHNAQRRGKLLMHPRCGVGTVDAQERVFSTLQLAGADVLSFQIDSLTRNNFYQAVDLALREPEDTRGGQGSLNGFPAVNHGAEAVYHLVERSGGVPVQVRHSTRDPRLLAEISYAGGVSSFEGGAICYNLPYYRDYDPAESVHAWRYVDLLTAHYQREYGLTLDREFFGTLTAALVPPCIAIASCILEALMAAQAGVLSVSLGYAEQGHRAQDIAAVRAMKTLAHRYLRYFGHGEVQVSTVFHQYMCAFPQDPELARQLLIGSAYTAAAAGATRMMLKTHVEATKIPSAEENAECLRMMRRSLPTNGRYAIDTASVDFEYRLILAEVTSIVDAALAAGENDVHRATVAAISHGLLDIPFSPSVWNAGRALTMRDTCGAVRFLEPGAIPLPANVLAIHQKRLSQRIREQAVSVDELIAEDIVAITEGRIAGWPLDARHANGSIQPSPTRTPAQLPCATE